MPGGMEDLNDRVAERQLLSIIERFKREGNLRRAMKAIRCAGALGELASTGSVIRMNVSVKHVGNLQFLGLGEGDVGFDVTFLRVDDHACTNGPSAEGIGGASCVVIIEGLEKHLADSPAREGGVDKLTSAMCGTEPRCGPSPAWLCPQDAQLSMQAS